MFLPENIDLNKAENYSLTIRISSEGWAFAIREQELGGTYFYQEEKFTTNNDILSNIQKLVFDFNFLSRNFSKTNVIFVSSDYELVPEYLFDKKESLNIYNLSHYQKAKRIFLSNNKIKGNVLLYRAENEIYSFLSRSLNNPSFWIHSELILEYLSLKNQNSEKGNKMYIYFHDNVCDLICYDNDSNIKQLISYKNETETNLVYYILNIWDKCGFNQKTDILYFIESNSTFIEFGKNIIKDYITNVRSLGLPSEVHLLGNDGQNTPIDVLTLLLK